MKSPLSKTGSTSSSALISLRMAYPSLPESYFKFLETTNGAEGELDVEPGWAVVWRAEDALKFSNQYQVPKYLPGYFAFGSNGGGELFVFAVEGDATERHVHMVPAIGIAPEELQCVAPSFGEFQRHIGRPFNADA